MRRSVKLALAAIAALPFLAAAAPAGPMPPALQQQLLGLYDSYNRAIGAGKVEEALDLRSADVQAELKPAIADDEARKEFLEFARFQAADSLQILHSNLAKDGNSATILAIASKKIPEDSEIPDGPKPGSTIRAELTLAFVKEGGIWKLGIGTFGVDPDKVVACKNQAYEPIDAYDRKHTVSAGGPIQRVSFNADHTLIIFRVLEEEDCAYLPDRATLAKQGVDPASLEPYAIVEIKGFPHKTDKQKIWIDTLTVRAE